jgi:hypothetical protein
MKRSILIAALACVLAAPVVQASAAQPEYLFEQPPAGAPNFTGKWAMPKPILKLTENGKAPPLNAAGRKAYAERQARLKSDPKSDPISECLIHGVPRLTYSPYPFVILHTTRNLALVHEPNHTFRIIGWNEPFPADEWGANWLGHSSAKIEGKTLVIDSQGFNDQTWLDYSGLPHGEKLKVQERFTLVGANQIRGEVVITDPDFYTRPWRSTFTLVKQQGMTIPENVCQDTHQM